MLYFDRVETHWPLRVQLTIGSRVPLHCTASGKLYLSSLPAVQRRRLIAQLDLKRNTENTFTDHDELLAEISKIRAQKIGVDNEEFMQGMIAVSVPIKDQRNRMYGGLALHAPVSRMSLKQARDFVPRLREASAELSAHDFE